MNGVGVGLQSVTELSRVLQTSCRLTRIQLKNNAITSFMAELIARSLENNSQLTHLDLAENSIGDDGAFAFAKLLNSGSSLVVLDLSGNIFSSLATNALQPPSLTGTCVVLLDDSSPSKRVHVMEGDVLRLTRTRDVAAIDPENSTKFPEENSDTVAESGAPKAGPISREERKLRRQQQLLEKFEPSKLAPRSRVTTRELGVAKSDPKS
eukprot:c2784_g1_i1.p1 GENE.c2784_g1_i1~~c2784_g1_i1.p1  ORF type:complete len:233 (-),score=62.96 c2784_g1_i1:879-1505(-)